ncbi:metalloendopeptidase [Caerostris extrusa]|uniref:Metalloendopeptidase n=1 Tax=Caerostris extrusa TaxID=172846 RepID=A0AAV4SDB5_CAEEX|nr:metalloendopeptidase [Caerostris extrusa]
MKDQNLLYGGKFGFGTNLFTDTLRRRRSSNHTFPCSNIIFPPYPYRQKRMVLRMTKYTTKCPNNASQCMNEGFLSPYRGNDEPCHCVCQPGSSGEFCENISDPYEYYKLPPCGGNVTEDTEIQTPGYPTRNPPADNCAWWIQAEKGKRVRVEFADFSFHSRLDRNDSMFHRRCYHERVEIRTKNRFYGDIYSFRGTNQIIINRFCGEDIPSGTVATSAGREFIIIIDTNEKVMEGRGLKAKVTFIDEKESESSNHNLKSLIPFYNKK